MVVKLPPTYITPYPETGGGTPGSKHVFWNPDISASQSYPAGMPNPMIQAIYQKADIYCGSNSWNIFQQQAVAGRFVENLLTLRMLAAADQRESEGRDLRSAFNEITQDLKWHPSINHQIVKYPSENRIFSGGLATPFHGFQHSVDGKGKSATFPIENIGLKVDISRIPDVMNAIQGARGVGRSSVDVNFPYNVSNDSYSSGLVLGNITLRAIGHVDKNSSGSWSFNGEIRAYNDFYDANPSNHRSLAAEAGTAFLRTILKDSYDIVIPGVLPISLNGYQ